jgi:hypothetical protein
MTEDQAEKIIKWIAERYDDGEVFSVHEGYSGRGMYGQTTTAITFSDLNLATGAFWIGRAVEALSEDDRELEAMRTLRFDQLGLGHIVY